MPEIFHILHINAPVSNIFKALTEQEGLSSWWTKNTIATPKVGSIAEFIFGKQYHNKMQIAKLVQDKEVVWICIEADPEWIGTQIKFLLIPGSDGIQLKFTHSNWKNSTEFLGHCNYQWGRYLVSLKDYCENGKGTPFIS